MLISVLGIYVCFLTWGITQERVTTTPYGGQKFKYFIFLNAIQSIGATLIAYIFLKLSNKKLPPVSRNLSTSFLKVSILSTLASPFGYASLAHLDYPTLILGKSCKLVPVMLMNFLLYKKTFPVYKYVVVVLITLGVSCFMLLQPAGEIKKSKVNSMFGLLLLTINLLIDGATNSTQDQIFHKHSISGISMMVYMSFFSSLLMIFYLFVGPYLPDFIASYELAEAFSFCGSHPIIIYDLILFALCGAIGQCFIFHTLEKYGSLMLVTVTVTRKMFSILLSAFWFNHAFSLGQWMAVGLVFLGIGLEAYMKRRESAIKRARLTESKGLLKNGKKVRRSTRKKKDV